MPDEYADLKEYLKTADTGLSKMAYEAIETLQARHEDDRAELNRMTADVEALQARVRVLTLERDAEAAWVASIRDERDVAIRQRNAALASAEAAEALARDPQNAARVLLGCHTVQTLTAAGKQLDLVAALRALTEGKTE